MEEWRGYTKYNFDLKVGRPYLVQCNSVTNRSKNKLFLIPSWIFFKNKHLSYNKLDVKSRWHVDYNVWKPGDWCVNTEHTHLYYRLTIYGKKCWSPNIPSKDFGT